MVAVVWLAVCALTAVGYWLNARARQLEEQERQAERDAAVDAELAELLETG